MDRKEFYLRQRVASASAAAATSPQVKLSHRKLAASYADRIENYDARDEGRYSSANSPPAAIVNDDASSLRVWSETQAKKASE